MCDMDESFSELVFNSSLKPCANAATGSDVHAFRRRFGNISMSQLLTADDPDECYLAFQSILKARADAAVRRVLGEFNIDTGSLVGHEKREVAQFLLHLLQVRVGSPSSGSSSPCDTTLSSSQTTTVQRDSVTTPTNKDLQQCQRERAGDAPRREAQSPFTKYEIDQHLRPIAHKLQNPRHELYCRKTYSIDKSKLDDTTADVLPPYVDVAWQMSVPKVTLAAALTERAITATEVLPHYRYRQQRKEAHALADRRRQAAAALRSVVQDPSLLESHGATATFSCHRFQISGSEQPFWQATLPRVSFREGFYRYENAPEKTAFVDFANRFLGGQVFGSGFAQEEEMCYSIPELLAFISMHAAPQNSQSNEQEENQGTSILWMADNEALLIRNVTAICIGEGQSALRHHSSRGQTAHGSQRARSRRVNVVAINAVKKETAEKHAMSRASLLQWHFRKAYTGFAAAKASGVNHISTGKWGCGVYGNDVSDMVTVQFAAAAFAGIDSMTFYDFCAADTPCQRICQTLGVGSLREITCAIMLHWLETGKPHTAGSGWYSNSSSRGSNSSRSSSSNSSSSSGHKKDVHSSVDALVSRARAIMGKRVRSRSGGDENDAADRSGRGSQEIMASQSSTSQRLSRAHAGTQHNGSSNRRSNRSNRSRSRSGSRSGSGSGSRNGSGIAGVNDNENGSDSVTAEARQPLDCGEYVLI